MASESAHVDEADSTIPVEAVPQPVARFVVRDDTAVLVETNERFESSFIAASADSSFHTWWKENGLTARDRTVADLESSLVAGESVAVTVTVDGTADETGGKSDETYRLSTEWTEDGTGTLALASTPARDDDLAGDQIASVISHDLRNPLDVAKAHLRAARETGDPKHFDSLENAHDRMERIIHDVLTLARREGAISPTPGVEIDSVARDAWSTVDTTRVSLALAPDLPAVEADPDRFQRLFENLFRNVVDHAASRSKPRTKEAVTHDSTADSSGTQDETPSRTYVEGQRARDATAQSDASVDDTEAVTGTGRSRETEITVRVDRTEDGFYVADDGPGVPQSDRERVFEPGYTDTDGGTGLGLTIVEQIAVAHDWTVTLQESDDGGARFEFHGVTATEQ
jgi:signal transduction histidine kinase